MQTEVPEIRSAARAASGIDLPSGSSIRARRRGAELAMPLLVTASDAIALTASHWIVVAGAQHWLRVSRSELEPGNYLLFYLPFLLVMLYLFGRGQSREARRPEKELELVVKGVSISFTFLVCANFVFFKGPGFSRYLMLSWYLTALSCLLGARFGLRALCAKLWEHGIARRRTLLIGSPEKVSELLEGLLIQRFQGYELVGTILVGDDEGCDGLRVLGPLERWQEIAREHSVEQVVVCLATASEETQSLVSDILRGCLEAGIDVEIHSDLFAAREFTYELDDFSGFFRFFPAPRRSQRAQKFFKVSLDASAGLFGSLLVVLLTPVIGALIKLEDGGPIFYRSKYVGPRGEDRYLLKFRSMRVDADRILTEDHGFRQQFEKQCKLMNDPRVTRVGRLLRKYSLDELPSFFNILRGDISFVGPRTIMWEQYARYAPFLTKLFSVKPGLTGFWQVMGRQLTTHEERVRMDMFYIDHWSIWLDIWIVGRTFWKVLRAEGAY